jgi:hypothetical protein
MSGTVASDSVSVSRRCSTWIGNSSHKAKATTKNTNGTWTTGVGTWAPARHNVATAAAPATTAANR